jgi:6-phosphogluconolactonase
MRNNLSFCIVLVLFVSGIEYTLAQPGSKDIIYAGTSSARGSKGIYVLEFDRTLGKLKELQTVTEGNGPGFLA